MSFLQVKLTFLGFPYRYYNIVVLSVDSKLLGLYCTMRGDLYFKLLSNSDLNVYVVVS